MPASPWKSFAHVDRDQEFLVLATYLPLNRFSSTLRFARFVGAIRKQLANAPGLLGYSMLGKPLTKRYWTLSIWKNKAALQAFVRQSPHQEVMSALAGETGATRCVRWTAQRPKGRPRGTTRSVACAEPPRLATTATTGGPRRSPLPTYSVPRGGMDRRVVLRWPAEVDCHFVRAMMSASCLSCSARCAWICIASWSTASASL
jgi:hypothetical protein